ncbi:MAG TPA: cupredoxin domain-containing protein [Nitrososphaeraceae archaeon]|nr:cupredoxin domain-containing protein [Nitrososphaeraceae archaeon]
MGHATIEWVYIGVVISLLTWVGAESWNVERIVEHVPAEAETIKVTGQQWFWTFEHQDGKKETGELHLKQGVPYKFELVSKDVIHNFNVPDFTILMDAVPGRVNVVWNLFDKPGEYHIQCREYCGFGHATMKAKLFVEPQTAEAAEATPAQGQNATSAAPAQGQNATSAAPAQDQNATSAAPAQDQNATSAAPAQGQNATSAAPAGPPGSPLTILEGSSIQGNPSYDPATLTVKKGDKITVTNKDTLPHTVTSGTGPTDPNSAAQFDTSILEAGATADIETTTINAGEYPFYCTVHPYMLGKLVVQ